MNKELKQLSKQLDVKIPIDGLMTVLLGKTIINIVELDNKLKLKYQDNYQDISFDDFIKSIFGIECLYIINKYSY